MNKRWICPWISMTLGVMSSRCAPVDDGFRAKLAAGCNSEEACAELQAQAERRYIRACVGPSYSGEDCQAMAQDRVSARELHEQRPWLFSQRTEARARIQTNEAPHAPTEKTHRYMPDNDCASDHEVRQRAFEKSEASIKHYNDLVDWANAHCVTVDNGRPTIATFEDSQGNITQREIISGYPVTTCSGKRPDGVDSAGNITFEVVQDPYEWTRDKVCNDIGRPNFETAP